jgi:hypothetical protein
MLGFLGTRYDSSCEILVKSLSADIFRKHCTGSKPVPYPELIVKLGFQLKWSIGGLELARLDAIICRHTRKNTVTRRVTS